MGIRRKDCTVFKAVVRIVRKCHHIHVDGVGKVLIPGCLGSAIYGPHACTCRPINEPTENQNDKKLIRELEKENAKLWRIIRKAQIDGSKI